MKLESLYVKYHKEHVPASTVDAKLIWRLLGYLRPYRGLVALSIVLLLAAKAIEAFVPIYAGKMLQWIVNGASNSPEAKQALFTTILHTGLAIIALLCLGFLLDLISMVIKNWVGQKALYSMRTQVYNHVQHFFVSYYDHHAVGHLLTRTIHDVEQISQMFTDSVVPIIGSLLLYLSMYIGIAIINWKLALLFILVLPIAIWITNRFRYYQRYCYDLIRNITSGMNGFVQEQLMGVSTIRNFNLYERERKIFEEINQDLRIANLETVHHFSFFIAGIDLLQNVSMVCVFVALVAFSAPNGGFQVGTYFTFSLYALMFFRPLADLAERYNVLQAAISAAERLFHTLDNPTEHEEHGPELDEITSIIFDNVWFAYEGQNWVLKGLSLHVTAKESLAIVGVTGAGKTSIINLLLRFYEFQKGSIKINGKDIREYPLHVLRRKFSVVLQDPVIFSGTIYDNISLYQSDITIERVNQVIDYMNLRPLIDRFPDGLQHALIERGKSLSMGEMQLISLARAVAHDRSVFILDEATANIDMITEQIIQNALNKVLRHKTAIVIAHRLSTIRNVDRIVVIHNGIVAESGSHQELLMFQGLYEKLYRIQFQSNIRPEN